MSVHQASFLRRGAGSVLVQDANGNGVLTAGAYLDYDQITGKALLYDSARRSLVAVETLLRMAERYPTPEEDAAHRRASDAPEGAEAISLQLLDDKGNVELRRTYFGMSIVQIGQGRIAIYDAHGTVRALVAPPFRIEVEAPKAEEAAGCR